LLQCLRQGFAAQFCECNFTGLEQVEEGVGVVGDVRNTFMAIQFGVGGVPVLWIFFHDVRLAPCVHWRECECAVVQQLVWHPLRSGPVAVLIEIFAQGIVGREGGEAEEVGSGLLQFYTQVPVVVCVYAERTLAGNSPRWTFSAFLIG
jgi:hypothetical protein